MLRLLLLLFFPILLLNSSSVKRMCISILFRVDSIPTLPSGLTFSTDAGTISGTPTAAATASTFVISAQHTATGSTSYSYSLSLSVIDCTGSRVRVDIVKHDTHQGSNEYWILKQGETEIDSHHGLDIFASQSITDHAFSYCLNCSWS